MITYSLRARIAKAGPAPAVWSRQIADLVAKKTGVTPRVSTRLGGPQEIVFVSQYDDFAALEKAQAILLADPDYNKMLETMQGLGLFESGSVDTAFWLPI
jgi:hypothetical protein